MIAAGTLRHRVTVQVKTITKDGEGMVNRGYSSAGSIWADMQSVGGEYALRKYGVTEEGISVRMITRVNSLVAMQNLITWDGVDYEIRHVSVFIDRYESLLRPVIR